MIKAFSLPGYESEPSEKRVQIQTLVMMIVMMMKLKIAVKKKHSLLIVYQHIKGAMHTVYNWLFRMD